MISGDIYGLIRSKDIGDFCRELGVKFCLTERVYLIGRSYLPIEKKHALLTEIIDLVPDCPTENYPSLHQFLMAYMAEENRVYELFARTGDNALYDGFAPGKFRSLEECLAAVRKIGTKRPTDILKKWLTGESICAKLNVGLEIYDLGCREELLSDEGRRLVEEFSGLMKVCLPAPFEPGDVLVRPEENLPFVFGGVDGGKMICHNSKSQRFVIDDYSDVERFRPLNKYEKLSAEKLILIPN